MFKYGKIYFFAIFLFSFCLTKAMQTEDSHLQQDVLKKGNEYCLTLNSKTALLNSLSPECKKFSVYIWPGADQDFQGKNLKVLALAFVTIRQTKKSKIRVHFEYREDETDPDIDTLLATLLACQD